MRSVKFKESNDVIMDSSNTVLFKAVKRDTDNFVETSCWTIAWWEILILVFTRKIWMVQGIVNGMTSPVHITVAKGDAMLDHKIRKKVSDGLTSST